MTQDFSRLHQDAVVVVGDSDIAVSDVDVRRESGKRNVLDRRRLPTLRAGGVTAICDQVGGDEPYGYLPATKLSTDHCQWFTQGGRHALGAARGCGAGHPFLLSDAARSITGASISV